jgi:hypothetical protein
LAFSSDISLVYSPVPEPSFVLLLEIVGFCEVLQQTPRSVTKAPSSEVIFPPLVAEFSVISETGKVVTVGIFEIETIDSHNVFSSNNANDKSIPATAFENTVTEAIAFTSHPHFRDAFKFSGVNSAPNFA